MPHNARRAKIPRSSSNEMNHWPGSLVFMIHLAMARITSITHHQGPKATECSTIDDSGVTADCVSSFTAIPNSNHVAFDIGDENIIYRSPAQWARQSVFVNSRTHHRMVNREKWVSRRSSVVSSFIRQCAGLPRAARHWQLGGESSPVPLPSLVHRTWPNQTKLSKPVELEHAPLLWEQRREWLIDCARARAHSARP